MTHKFLKNIFLVFLVVCVQLLNAQDFMMQAYYWNYPKTTDGYNWADTLIGHAEEINDAGITFVSLPPLARANSGNSSNGYDPKDLFDYGEHGGGATGFGTRTDLDNVIDAFGTYGIKTVADLVLNHRDGGEYENNSALETYNTNYDYSTGDQPYPYDRYRVILPIGSGTGNAAGHYYFKVTTRSGHVDFTGVEYSFHVVTSKVGDQGSNESESEPNGGDDCDPDQDSDTIQLGVTINAENFDYNECWTDEFLLILDAADFNSGGDTIVITFGKRNSDYSDMYVYGLYSSYTSSDIVSQLDYQTATDFSDMPSNRGEMDWSNFKPNNDRSTSLSGNWDAMLFYLDYDQYQQQTYDTLNNWAEWNWDEIGMRGFRMDAVKHYPPEFVGNLLDFLHDNSIDPNMVVGELYSANTGELNTWITDVKIYMNDDTKAAIKPRIYDFSLRDNLREACDDNANFDVRSIFTNSLHDDEGTNGENIVTFVNNHDFRGDSDFESLIQNDPMLAYAYILTNNQVGLPTIFYPDYFGFEDDGTSYYPTGDAAAPHGDEMKKLIEIHTSHIYGATILHYLNESSSVYSNDLGSTNDKVLVYQMEGGPSGKAVVVAINFDAGPDSVQFHQQLDLTNLSFNDTLTDLMGGSVHKYAIVKNDDVNNSIWIDLPPRSYAIWVQGDTNDIIPLRPQDIVIDSINETRVVLSWTDNSNNESGFKIYATEGENVTLLATTTSDIETYTYSGLTQDKDYSFEVKATNAKGDSESAKGANDRTWVKWDGSMDSDWATAANWGSGNVVSSASKIIIPDVTNDPQIASIAECDRMNIESGGHLEITETYSLSINDLLYNLAGNTGIVLKSSSAGTGSLITLGTVSGGGTVERYFSNLSSKGDVWYLVSPPISNATANVFFDEYLQYWDEPTELYVSIEDETTALSVGQGYANKKTQDNTEYFEGSLNTGDISAPLMRWTDGPAHPNPSDDYTGWNLMGNPYPSALDWDQVAIPVGMGSTVSVWSQSLNSGLGDWYAWNGAGDTEAQNIGIAQGFFVLVSQDNVTLSFENADRTHTNASNFYKTTTTDVPQLKISVRKNEYSNHSFIVFNEDAVDSTDIREDGIKFFTAELVPHIYSMVDDKKLVINALPFPESDKIVHLGFRVNAIGNYRLSINGLNYLNDEQSIFLSDKVSGEIHDLQLDSVINFDYLNSDPENRFDIIFGNITNTENLVENQEIWNVYSSKDRLFIQSENDLKADVQIFNIQGQLVYSSSNIHSFKSGVNLKLPSAYYLVKLVSEENVQVGKVFIL